MTKEQKLDRRLIDDIMRIKAELAGKRMELAYARGLTREAHTHRKRMEELVMARRNAMLAAAPSDREECYFAAAGEADMIGILGK